MILTSLETLFIPSNIKAVQSPLNNLLARAQALAESFIGRNLELHDTIDTIALGNYPPYTIQLREWPVNSILEVRIFRSDWIPTTDFSQVNSTILLKATATAAKITYNTGWDFTPPATDRDVIKIKHHVGQLALAIERLDRQTTADDPRSALRPWLLPFNNYRKL